MKIEYMKPDSPDVRAEITKQIKKRGATILSRLSGEVVALIPASHYDDDTYSWVWPSSQEDGAYISNSNIPLDKVVGTIIFGEWKLQPNAKIVLEEK